MVRLAVRAHPRASRTRLRWDGQTLDVWVTAPPAEGAANAAIVKAIAGWLDVSPSAVRLVSGQRGRSKLVEIDGLTSVPTGERRGG